MGIALKSLAIYAGSLHAGVHREDTQASPDRSEASHVASRGITTNLIRL